MRRLVSALRRLLVSVGAHQSDNLNSLNKCLNWNKYRPLDRMSKLKWFYAVKSGKETGVFNTWDECKDRVEGFKGASYKKFRSEEEAWNFAMELDKVNFDSPLDEGSNWNGEKTDSNNRKPDWSEGPTTFTPNASAYSKSASSPRPFYNQSRGPFGSSRTSRAPGSSGWSQSSGQALRRTAGRGRAIRKQNASPRKAVYLPIQDIPSGSRRGGEMATSGNANRDIYGNDKWNSAIDKMDPNLETVYTDGACEKNGRKGSKAGIGVYWGPNSDMNVSERLPGRQTNNRAEIHAAVRALDQARKKGLDGVNVCTDSKFLILGVNAWMKKWKRNGWKLANGDPVVNKEDFEALDKAQRGLKVNWVHVRGHRGIEGNVMADHLARRGSHTSTS